MGQLACSGFERLGLAEFRELLVECPEAERRELVDGLVYRMMAGVTLAHNLIVQNIAGALRDDLRVAAVTDARAIVEVVSADSRNRDSSRKPSAYQSLPGLMHSALVEQERVSVTHDSRDGEAWRFETLLRPDEALDFGHLGVRLPLARISADALAED